jgi:hypothetical protein
MQSSWQNLNYIAKYGSVRQQPKSTHWIVKYGDKVLTRPMYYSGCQLELKTFKMQGSLYPDKSKFKIVGI